MRKYFSGFPSPETSIDKFRQAGAKPFVLAGLLYVWLVAGGYFVTKYLVGIL